jgi:hypothetical protein
MPHVLGWVGKWREERLDEPAPCGGTSSAPYSDTPDITMIGSPPYYVVDEACEPEQLGKAIRRAMDASGQETTASADLERISEDRGLELARLAGVSDRKTFERRTRYVSFDCVGEDQILVTPHFRKRGYWEPVPERSG